MAQASSNTVLLVMDVQPGILDMVKEKDVLVKTLNKSIDAARAAQISVIFVVVGFRKGFPEISRDSKMYSRLKDAKYPLEDPPVHPLVNPQPDDIVVRKRRVSAFAGSDLEVILRALKADRLVLTGIATSGVVLSTLREAADKDFGLTVLSDGCAGMDPQVHEVLLNKVFVKQADVIISDEWIGQINKTA